MNIGETLDDHEERINRQSDMIAETHDVQCDDLGEMCNIKERIEAVEGKNKGDIEGWRDWVADAITRGQERIDDLEKEFTWCHICNEPIIHGNCLCGENTWPEGKQTPIERIEALSNAFDKHFTDEDSHPPTPPLGSDNDIPSAGELRKLPKEQRDKILRQAAEDYKPTPEGSWICEECGKDWGEITSDKDRTFHCTKLDGGCGNKVVTWYPAKDPKYWTPPESPELKAQTDGTITLPLSNYANKLREIARLRAIEDELRDYKAILRTALDARNQTVDELRAEIAELSDSHVLDKLEDAQAQITTLDSENEKLQADLDYANEAIREISTFIHKWRNCRNQRIDDNKLELGTLLNVENVLTERGI